MARVTAASSGEGDRSCGVGAGTPCTDCSVRFSPPLSPNRTCAFQRIRLSIELLIGLAIAVFSLVACQAQSFEIIEAVGFRALLVMYTQTLGIAASYTLEVVPHLCPQFELRKFKRFVA